MVKMRMVNLCNCNNVPEHVIAELQDTIRQVVDVMAPVLVNTHPNLVLSAMNHIHAIIIDKYINDEPEEKKKGALMAAKSLLKNVEFYAKIDIFEREDGI